MVFQSVKEVAVKAHNLSSHEQMIIGINHCLGLNGYEKDIMEGRAWLWVAATYYKSFIAQYNWASTWLNQPFYKVEEDISPEDLQTLADENNSAAIYMLGVFFSKTNPTQAFKYYQKASENNLCPAINNLASSYESGEGVEQNITKAIELYNIAAEQEIAAAEWSLGQLYFNGELVTKNIQLAQYWLQKAEENVWFPAQELLNSIDENYQIIEQFTNAAIQGDADSQLKLGLLYLPGTLVEQDSELARKWLSEAANQSNQDAQYNLGLMYAHGINVPQDYKLAAEWYQKAAEKGLADAQFNLGVLYIKRLGVSQDYQFAKTLFKNAADQGHENAQIVISQLTP